jgi:chromosome partitioning protein
MTARAHVIVLGNEKGGSGKSTTAMHLFVALARADTLVTPLNDSFVDFDMLARIDPETQKVLGPSVYAEMVWGARQSRARAGLKATDWIVLRNRLGTTEMHNKRRVGAALEDLARRIGFRVAPGFTERVIFRELFPRGMTLLDLKDIGVGSLNLSNVAARQEVRDLIASLRLPHVEAALQTPESEA